MNQNIDCLIIDCAHSFEVPSHMSLPEEHVLFSLLLLIGGDLVLVECCTSWFLPSCRFVAPTVLQNHSIARIRIRQPIVFRTVRFFSQAHGGREEHCRKLIAAVQQEQRRDRMTPLFMITIKSAFSNLIIEADYAWERQAPAAIQKLAQNN